MLYGAKCLISKQGRDRVIPVEEIFGGVQKISLKPGEILTEFRLPPPDPGLRGCYLKFSPRKAMDLPIVGVGVLVSAEKGTFQDVRIALGAVASTPIRAQKAEKLLSGKPISAEWIRKAAKEAATESKPISDLRASAEYRRASGSGANLPGHFAQHSCGYLKKQYPMTMERAMKTCKD